jgi:hypothetical protein
LSSIREIKHQVDLVLGVVVPNIPTYQSNPKDTKELQGHVEELMLKGYILLLPIFGFPQKMRKYKKIYIKKYSKEIQKIIGARKGCWNAEK